jgi:hypothetical protein
VAPEVPAAHRWVISFLVTGDEAGVMVVSAEGLIKTTLWGSPDGPQPLASTVARFGDLSPSEQDRWRFVLDHAEDDW